MPPQDVSPDSQARLAARDRPRQDDFADVEVPALPPLPGMIMPSEQRYLYWLTRHGYTGAGAVVEVGPWLGASTQCLAAGMRDSGVAAPPLRTFDMFQWKWGRDPLSGLDLAEDADFRPYFERNLAAFGASVVATKGDAASFRWTEGPVEILFIDGPKNGPSAARTLAAFAAALRPGLTLVVFQDMLHSPSWALAMLAAELEDALELVHVVDGGSTVAYRLRAPLDAARLRAQRPDLARPVADGERLWQRTFEQIQPPLSRAYFAPGIAMYLYEAGRRDEARRRVRDMIARPEVRRQWERWAAGDTYQRFRGLFRELGMGRPLHRELLDTARRVGRAALRPRRTAARVWRRIVKA